MDGPAGRPTDNPPDSHLLGVYHQTIRELWVRVYWAPRLPIWQWFGFGPDPDPKWRSGTVANTSDGHNLENGTAMHAEILAEADGAWRIHSTVMGRRSRPLGWERNEVQDGQIQDSGHCQPPHRYECSYTIIEDIWRAHADSWYRRRTIAHAAGDFPTRNQSNTAGIWEPTVIQIHSISPGRSSALFVTQREFEARFTPMVLPLHLAPIAYYNMEIGFGRINSHGSCVAGGIDSLLVTFDDLCRWKAISVPILLLASVFRISETKLYDKKICQCMCKGHTGHAKVLNSKSSW